MQSARQVHPQQRTRSWGYRHVGLVAGAVLFFAMLLGVSDRCLFRMSSGVNGVRSSADLSPN
jgi:hypothetical protein